MSVEVKKYKKRRDDEDSGIDDSKLSDQSQDDDFPNIMENSDYEDRNEFLETSEGKISKNKSSSRKRRHQNPVSKESESQTTFLLNIQTTADLISYVNSRHQKERRKTGAKGKLTKRTSQGSSSKSYYQKRQHE